VTSEERLEQVILDLLDQRGAGKTICPSDAARAAGTPDTWRALMEDTRRAAYRLAEAGRVEITQHGARVEPGAVRGPIRIRSARDD
jgi:hypothetical protein